MRALDGEKGIKRSIRSRIIAAILTALMIMTLLPVNAISFGGDTAGTVAPGSHYLKVRKPYRDFLVRDRVTE